MATTPRVSYNGATQPPFLTSPAHGGFSVLRLQRTFPQHWSQHSVGYAVQLPIFSMGGVQICSSSLYRVLLNTSLTCWSNYSNKSQCFTVLVPSTKKRHQTGISFFNIPMTQVSKQRCKAPNTIHLGTDHTGRLFY